MKNSHHYLYNTWKKMRDRCNNPKSHNYKYYGGKGIKVCQRWDSFELFIKDIGERPSEDYTLDRINQNGDYNKSNCRWATIEIQNSNRSSCTIVNGKTLAQHARDIGISKNTVYKRLKRGWDLTVAITRKSHIANKKSRTETCKPIDTVGASLWFDPSSGHQ